MKKYVLFILSIILLTGCSKSLKSDAVEALEDELKHDAFDPRFLEVDDIETIVDDDSICLIQCVVRNHNSFGEMTRMEYVYLLNDDGEGGGFSNNLEKNISLLKEFRNRVIEHPELFNFDPDKESDKKEFYKSFRSAMAMKYDVMSTLEDFFGNKYIEP